MMMTLRELQKVAHDLRQYSERICTSSSSSYVHIRAVPEGIVVIAAWGNGQLQFMLTPTELTDRPCDNSLEVIKRILRKRMGGERVIDAKDDPSGNSVPGSTP